MRVSLLFLVISLFSAMHPKGWLTVQLREQLFFVAVLKQKFDTLPLWGAGGIFPDL